MLRLLQGSCPSYPVRLILPVLLLAGDVISELDHTTIGCLKKQLTLAWRIVGKAKAIAANASRVNVIFIFVCVVFVVDW